MKEIDRLAGYLKGRDAPCPGCGHNLRDLIGLECPECGEALTVVKIIYNAPRASLAGVVFGFMGLVCGSVRLGFVWPVMMSRPQWRLRRHDITKWDGMHLMLIAATLGMTMLLITWWHWMDEMRCRPARFRWGWAVACWLSVPSAWLLGQILEWWAR